MDDSFGCGQEPIYRLTCPECGHRAKELMPIDACQFYCDRKNCGVVLRHMRTGDQRSVAPPRGGSQVMREALGKDKPKAVYYRQHSLLAVESDQYG